MKLFVSYWLVGISDAPEDTIITLKETTLNLKTINEIKSKIVDESGENIDESEVTIINIIKLDK